MANAYGHEPGKPLECLSLETSLKKEPFIDQNGQQAYKVGFRIGGGIDQDPSKAPFRYPDTGIYITQVESGSPADAAGLKQHDKLLRVNGVDFTMVPHDKAVKVIRKDLELNIVLTRPEIAFGNNQ
ncbi:PDZ domain (Also known as DHR or GLGF) domain-containing protein [Ditylenchus destructor]|nr:PDZ domain (Also known as DHR or GLGF) domain-containing protein [Ditylenchus destructor]